LAWKAKKKKRGRIQFCRPTQDWIERAHGKTVSGPFFAGIIAACSAMKTTTQETSMRNLITSAASLAVAAGVISTMGLALCLAPDNAWAAGDVEAGKVKAYTCTGCHGIPGYNNAYPSYKVPKIGGQNYVYLVAALKAYRAGDRHHATMELQGKALSDQDIEDIAAYFASLGGGK
jgi:cytochrome c553